MLNTAGRKSYIAGIVFAIVLLPGAEANVQAQSDWRTEWEKTLAAAKKEGRVVIHAGPGQEAFFAEFDKKYPEIKAGRDSLRIDIPKDDVREDVRRRKGVKYSVLVDPKYMDLDPIRKLVKEVWRRKR